MDAAGKTVLLVLDDGFCLLTQSGRHGTSLGQVSACMWQKAKLATNSCDKLADDVSESMADLDGYVRSSQSDAADSASELAAEVDDCSASEMPCADIHDHMWCRSPNNENPTYNVEESARLTNQRQGKFVELANQRQGEYSELINQGPGELCSNSLIPSQTDDKGASLENIRDCGNVIRACHESLKDHEHPSSHTSSELSFPSLLKGTAALTAPPSPVWKAITSELSTACHIADHEPAIDKSNELCLPLWLPEQAKAASRVAGHNGEGKDDDEDGDSTYGAYLCQDDKAENTVSQLPRMGSNADQKPCGCSDSFNSSSSVCSEQLYSQRVVRRVYGGLQRAKLARRLEQRQRSHSHHTESRFSRSKLNPLYGLPLSNMINRIHIHEQDDHTMNTKEQEDKENQDPLLAHKGAHKVQQDSSCNLCILHNPPAINHHAKLCKTAAHFGKMVSSRRSPVASSSSSSWSHAHCCSGMMMDHKHSHMPKRFANMEEHHHLHHHSHQCSHLNGYMSSWVKRSQSGIAGSLSSCSACCSLNNHFASSTHLYDHQCK